MKAPYFAKMLVDCEQKVPNSYVSLVMTEEDFLKINQDIDWDKYMS